jgi:hypothetical protein
LSTIRHISFLSSCHARLHCDVHNYILPVNFLAVNGHCKELFCLVDAIADDFVGDAVAGEVSKAVLLESLIGIKLTYICLLYLIYFLMKIIGVKHFLCPCPVQLLAGGPQLPLAHVDVDQ